MPVQIIGNLRSPEWWLRTARKPKSVSKGLLAGLFARCGATCSRERAAQRSFLHRSDPDPQNYSEKSSLRRLLGHQTQWMVTNRTARNIRFVVHLGDITNYDNAVEFYGGQRRARHPG